MVPVIVEVTVRIEAIAPSVPAAASAVVSTMNRAICTTRDPILKGGQWQVIAAERPH